MYFAALHLTHSFPAKGTIYRSVTQTRAMDSARAYVTNNNTIYSGPIVHYCPGTVHVPVTDAYTNGIPEILITAYGSESTVTE